MSQSKVALLFGVLCLIFTMGHHLAQAVKYYSNCVYTCNCDCSSSNPCTSCYPECCLDSALFKIDSAKDSNYKNLPIKKAAFIVSSAQEKK